MKTGRRLLSFILALATVLTLVPAFGTSVAWAAGDTLTKNVGYGLVLEDGKIYTKTGTTKGGECTSEYSGHLYYENDHWVMKDLNLTTTQFCGIESYSPTVLEVVGTNSVEINTGSVSYAYGIYAKALTVTGSGILNISVTAGANSLIYGLDSMSENITVSGATLNITVGNVSNTSDYEKSCHGIHAYGKSCTFINSKVTVTAGATDKASDKSYGIYSTGINVIGSDCVITASSINNIGAAYPIYIDSASAQPSASAVDGSGTTLTYDSAKRTYVDGSGNISKTLIMREPHRHDFTYEADGNTITAICHSTSGGGCKLPDNKETITVASPTDLMYTGSPKEARILADIDKLECVTNLSADSIEYYLSDGTTKTTSANGAVSDGKAPANVGSYVAKLTVGDTTASISYDITRRKWDTLPTVTVTDFPIQRYDESLHQIANSAGITKDIKYYYVTTNTNIGGTECTKENLNTLSSGAYYAYAVIATSTNMDGCVTEPSKFEVHHVHTYSFTKESGVNNKIFAKCTSNDGYCGDAKEITLKIDNAVYTGKPYVPYGVTKFIQEVGTDTAVTVDYYNGTDEYGYNPLSSAPVAAGDYIARISVGGVQVRADFKIVPQGVDKPECATQTYVYNGSKQTYDLASSCDYQLVFGSSSATTVGSCNVVIELKDKENTCWNGDEGTDNLVFTDALVITPKAIRKVTESSVKDYYYSGGYQVYGYEDDNWRMNYCSADYTISSYYGITVGTYTAIISLNDKENTLWDDGTTSDVAIKFEIKPLQVPVPVADPRTFYAIEDNTYQAFYQAGDYFYSFDGVFYNVTNNKRSKASGAGIQTVSVTPAENMEWDDGTGRTATTFAFTVEEEDAYGRIRYLINKEFGNDLTDGYSYASYMFDTENPSNMYVTTHFEASMYLYPSDASYEIYYTQNPNNLNPATDKKWSSLKYTDIQVPGGADYASYYIYAVVKAAGYKTYTTRPYEVFVYSPAVMVATSKKVTVAVEKQKSAKVPLGKRSSVSVPAGTETVYETKNQTTSQRYFSYAPYAGAAVLRVLNAGAEFVNVTYMSNPSQVYVFQNNNHDKKVVKDNFEVPNSLDSNSYASLMTYAPRITSRMLFASLTMPMPMLAGAENTQQSQIAVTPSAINSPKLNLATDTDFVIETFSKYLTGSSILQDYQLFGDEIGYKGIEGFKKGNKESNATTAGLEAFITTASFTVTFDNMFITSGAVVTTNAIYTTASVKMSSTVAKPEDPVLEDWTFDGWYYIPYVSSRASGAAVNILDDGIEWDFDKYTVVDNITLYAYWETPADPVDEPTYNISVSGEKGRVNISATLSGNTASVSNISANQIKKAGTEGNIVMDLTSLSKSITGINIQKSTVENVAESESSGLEILLPNGLAASFDKDALSAISSQAKGSVIKLVVDKESKAEKSMNAAQKAAVKDMKNPVVLDAYFTSNGEYISSFNGGKAEISVPCDPEKLFRAWFVSDEGEKTRVPSSKKDGVIILTVEHFSHYVIEEVEASDYDTCLKDSTCVLSKYTDIKLDGWYHNGIHFCVEMGYMDGYGNNLFGPEDTLSRSMIVQILYNMENKPAVAEKSTFTDVETDAWYADAIAWAEDNDIVRGCGNGLFGPEEDITREQLALILQSYAKYKGYDVTATAELTEFTDASGTSDWALEALKWAKAVELVSGKGNGILDPTGSAIRAEVATMIKNFCENIAK